VNATLNKNFADAVSKNCPKALVAIISNPVNSTVPIFSEQMKKNGTYDKNRVFGVTTLDIVRAHTFVAEAAGVDVTTISIPVVGGHAGASILPLLSQVCDNDAFFFFVVVFLLEASFMNFSQRLFSLVNSSHPSRDILFSRCVCVLCLLLFLTHGDDSRPPLRA
jgi:hypothetical protein